MKMKKLTLIFSLLLFLSIACEKEYLIPQNEIPTWLNDIIEKDEQSIKDFPKSWRSYGAWFRYKWSGTYYFEYQNPLSSLILPPISQNQDTISFFNAEAFKIYCENRCCERYVWKGPKYDALPH